MKTTMVHYSDKPKNEESFAPIENIQIQLKNEFIRDQQISA